MVRSDLDTNGHINDNQLAALADYGPDVVAIDVIEHMANCPHCMSAWAAAARRRGRVLSGVPCDVVPGPLLDEACALAAAPARRSSARRLSTVSAALGAGGLLVAAMLAVAVLTPRTTVVVERPVELVAALRVESSHGLIFPGVTGDLPVADGTFRSGGAEHPGLASLLSELVTTRVANPADREITRQLILAWIATDRHELAAELIRRERTRAAGDRELRHLEAIVSWRSSRLEQARALLFDLVAEDGRDEIARFNLALVQQETEQAAAARAELAELAGTARNDAVRLRSRQLISN